MVKQGDGVTADCISSVIIGSEWLNILLNLPKNAKIERGFFFQWLHLIAKSCR